MLASKETASRNAKSKRISLLQEKKQKIEQLVVRNSLFEMQRTSVQTAASSQRDSHLFGIEKSLI